jgi:hypothetical protein
LPSPAVLSHEPAWTFASRASRTASQSSGVQYFGCLSPSTGKMCALYTPATDVRPFAARCSKNAAHHSAPPLTFAGSFAARLPFFGASSHSGFGFSE